MTTQKKDGNSQERIAGALGAFFFVIPALMGQKTEFTLFYMRQNFLLVLINLLLAIIGMILSFLSFLSTIIMIINIAIFFLSVFLIWKAYSGEKFAVPYLYDASLKVIKMMKFDSFFSVK